MAKFIIFTNNNEGCFPLSHTMNPFTTLNITNYGNDSSIAVIGSENNQGMAKIPTTPNFNYAGYDILLYIDSKPNMEIITNFVGNENNVYVLLHSGTTANQNQTKSQQKAIIKDVMGDNFEFFIEQSHDSKSIYWNELIEIAECINAKSFNQKTYNKLLEKLKSRWPNLYLESLIHLHKTASVALLKNLDTEFNNWLNSLDGKYALAKDVLSNENGAISDLDSLANWTSSKIIELSK